MSAGRIYFDGVDLSGADYGVTVTAASVPRAAPRDIAHQDIPYYPGGISRVVGPQQRQISVTAVQVGDTPADFRAKHDRLIWLLSQAETKPLIIDLDDRWPDRYWPVLLTSAPPPDAVRQHRVARFTLGFAVPGAYGYSTTLTERTVALAASPTSFTQTVGGSAQASPVYEVENNAAETVTSVKIDNTTTGKAITWGGQLEQGNIIRIDTDAMLAEFSSDGGTTWSASMANLSTGHEWPRFAARVDNTIEVTGVADGELRLSYRDTYL